MDGLKVIATMHCDLPQKFGVPRQSGLVEELIGRVVFEPEYRVAEALRGLEGFSHIWLLWGFSKAACHDGFQPTVRPPRLGGNRRLGVFATRSPFRPNPIGLSCVRLTAIEITAQGPVLVVAGADLADGTPIYDIKPYLPYADCKPTATGGFADAAPPTVPVDFPQVLLEKLPESVRAAAKGILAQDPRPKYVTDNRSFGLSFAGFNICFAVDAAGVHVTAVNREK